MASPGHIIILYTVLFLSTKKACVSCGFAQSIAATTSLCIAFRTDALVIQLHIVNHIVAYAPWGHYFLHVVKHVNHPAAVLAIEMCMHTYVTVIAHPVVVDCNHLRSLFLRKHPQGVIHRSPAQCWNFRTKGVVHIFNRRVSAVVKQILHDSYALNRRLHAVLHQSVVCQIVSHRLCFIC